VDDTVTFLAINGEIIEQIGDQQQRWGAMRKALG